MRVTHVSLAAYEILIRRVVVFLFRACKNLTRRTIGVAQPIETMLLLFRPGSKIESVIDMNGSKSIFYCLCVTIAFVSSYVRGEHENETNLNDTIRFDISQGVTLYVTNEEARVTLRMSSLIKGNEQEQQGTGRLKFKKGILQKIGMAMMMAPLTMQLLSLPSALASIKISLLRSILVGKIALAVMLFNVLRSSQKSEVVVVHKPEYHEHYYHNYHQPEDDDGGWWSRRKKRHSIK